VKEEVIHVSEAFYILATSARIDDRTRVLKHGDTFGVFDRFGDIESFGSGEMGLFHQDTRFLSRLALSLEGDRPLLLGSVVREDNTTLAVDAMNPDLGSGDDVTTPRGTIHLFRTKFLWNATCHERIRLHNYGRAEVRFGLRLALEADFADIFEIRGTRRERHGRRLPALVGDDTLVHTYEGLDDRTRRTVFRFEPAPTRLDETQARYDLRLPAGGALEIHWGISCELDDSAPGARAGARGPRRYEADAREAAADLERRRAALPHVHTASEPFNRWVERSAADLRMMWSETEYGSYPYAGVPWFCTAFGRDGIITALECLSFDPELARGVLTYLAATQAETESPEQDAEPGKVLHETRAGEMAATGEVPFRRYYGSIDATPLFVMLAGAHLERTGDTAFARRLWPHVERALNWIDRFGDRDGDGFVEYARRSSHGLVQQGWKDSHDSVFHADGSAAEGPIALCEVQAYVYAARLAAARMAAALGRGALARTLTDAAHDLRRRFEAAFWCDDLGTYALALDGAKQPCRVRASNAGHCLFTGIAGVEHARALAATLATETSFSGWGVRTVAASEGRYNPMSYHNGSVWPHDSALIAAGLARYERKEQTAAILAGLLDASAAFDLHRLPELFCGFPRRPGEAPIAYPVACAPQSWAAGAVFLLLESCLGLRVLGAEGQVVLTQPFLPASLPWVSIRALRVGDAELDLLVARHTGGDVGVNVLRRAGEVEVVIRK
jgi:glycogen debranching enzyme